MHYNALTLTSNSMTEQEYWFFDSDSSSNQSVQSRRCVWILLVMVASASSLPIQLLSSNYSVYFNSYIPTHHQDLHIRSQRAKQKTNHMKYHTPQMATGSKTNIETSWNSSNKHPSDMFSGRNKTNETIWTLPNLIPHAVPLFISILQRFDSTYLKMNETISIFRCQRIWFYSAPTGSSSDFSLRHILLQCSLAMIANPALQSTRQECLILIQRLLNLLLALINALFLHCWRPVWTSTFLDITSDAAMQQRFNRRVRSWIFEWISDVGLCLYAKGQVQVLQAWRIWGTPFLHLIAQLALKKAVRLWDDLASCQCLSKRLSQTCIAVILVWCDNHVPGIRNISKTNHFHPCIGSGTNWLRVNCWCCTLQYFIWPEQETNRHSIVHDWLYLPCPRGASHPVSITCATDWHFLSHP